MLVDKLYSTPFNALDDLLTGTKITRSVYGEGDESKAAGQQMIEWRRWNGNVWIEGVGVSQHAQIVL